MQLKLSEIKSKLGALLDTEERSDTYAADLETCKVELRAAESDLQAALLIDGEPDTVVVSSERRELADLERRSNVGEFVGAVLEGRQIDGAVRELQQHYGLNANQLPVELLRGSELEERVVTPAPGEVGQTQNAIIPYVFPTSVTTFLGISMPTVAVGESVYSVLTSALSVETPAENAVTTETTGAFSADVLTPARLQASFFYSVEDRSRLAGMDAALRMNISDGIMAGLDKQVVSGTNGLLTGTNLDNHNVSAITAYDDYLNNFAYGRVDGVYADGVEDLKIVMGQATYGHAGSVYRSGTQDTTALDKLMNATSGVRASAHVPAVSGMTQNAVIRLGMRMDAVAPVWQGVTFINDEVTKAANGQVVLTGIMLYAMKILRKSGFFKQMSQHA